jgi:hypothetical protein
MASLKSIDPALDLGNGLTVETYQQSIDQVSKVMEDYNTQLSLVECLGVVSKINCSVYLLRG